MPPQNELRVSHRNVGMVSHWHTYQLASPNAPSFNGAPKRKSACVRHVPVIEKWLLDVVPAVWIHKCTHTHRTERTCKCTNTLTKTFTRQENMKCRIQPSWKANHFRFSTKKHCIYRRLAEKKSSRLFEFFDCLYNNIKGSFFDKTFYLVATLITKFRRSEQQFWQLNRSSRQKLAILIWITHTLVF